MEKIKSRGFKTMRGKLHAMTHPGPSRRAICHTHNKTSWQGLMGTPPHLKVSGII